MATPCVPVQMPPVTADFCAPVIAFGEINKIYLGNQGNPFTDWTDVAEWTARLDNADVAAADKIRTLHVIGDKPAPERTKVEFSQGRSVYTDPKHSINVRVDEVADLNYTFLKWLEDNTSQNLRVWYEAGGYLHGGPEGVSAAFILDHIIPESSEELQSFNGVISWEGSHPLRILSPIA